jgi:hypothetical protein
VVTDESLGAIASEVAVVNHMYMYMYRCTAGIFYVHVGPRRGIPVKGSLHVHVPVPCILAESVRVTPVPADPEVAKEVEPPGPGAVSFTVCDCCQ